jgi:hypothetical protein
MQIAPTAAPTRQRNSRGHFVKGNGAAPLVTPQPRATPPPRVNASAAAGPRSLDPTPPVLALFRHDAIAILRIHDLAFSGVVSAVVQSLPGDVTMLMLVTPTDTKMFAVNAGGQGHAIAKGVGRNQQPTEELEPNGGISGEESDEDLDPQAEAVRLAAEGDQASVAAGMEEAPPQAANREAVKEFRKATAAAASDPCGRCGGSGKIAIALPDGGASEAACGVCRGAGVIRRYGVRR